MIKSGEFSGVKDWSGRHLFNGSVLRNNFITVNDYDLKLTVVGTVGDEGDLK